MNTTNQNRRPAPTVNNSRFGWVRADEVRVRDVVERKNVDGTTTRETVMSVTWVGPDVQFVTRVAGTWEERRFETSEGNGVNVTGRV